MSKDDKCTIIGKELACSICQELLQEPKVVGPCLHTFCKQCILQLVESGENKSNLFSCPVCRATCHLPHDGVQDLKTNFTLANLVEIFRTGTIGAASRGAGEERAEDQPGYVTCSWCRAKGRKLQATFMCEDGACMYTTFCDICRKQHEVAPDTSGHVLIELCQQHGRPLGMFCRICKCCACADCVDADHSNGPHEVAELGLVTEESIKSLDNFLECAEKPLMTTLQSSRETVVMLKREIENRRDVLKGAVNARTKAMGAPDQEKREELARKRARLLKKLKALDSKVEVLDGNDTKRQAKTVNMLGRIDSIFDVKATKVHDCVENLNMKEGEMSTAIRMGHILKTQKIIGASRHGNITRTASLLRELMAKVKIDSDVSPYYMETFYMPAYSSGSAATDPDDLGRLTMSYARKVFDLSFGMSLDFNGDILAVVATNEGILAALCKGETEQKVYIWSLLAATVKRVLDKSTNQNIDLLVNMAASPDSKLVLLRKRAPQLIIVSPSMGTIKTIKVSKLRDPESVAVTQDGFFLVMEGQWPANLVVINEKGELIHSIATERVQRRIVWGQRAVFTTDWQRIFPYSWMGARYILKEPAFEHSISDFNMVDLTLGNNTGIFVIGLTSSARIKVYRLQKAQEAEPHNYNEFTLTDERGVEVFDGITAKCPVSLDICGSHLIMSYKDLNDQSRAVYYRLVALD